MPIERAVTARGDYVRFETNYPALTMGSGKLTCFDKYLECKVRAKVEDR